MEKKETLFFCGLPRRHAHYHAHFKYTGSFCLVSLDEILSYFISKTALQY